MAYSWLTFAAAKQQLAARLADPTNQFWTDAENGLYITEALQTWNALTFTWKTSFTFTLAAASSVQWLSLATLTGSPRLRSQTDTAVYTLIQYHLLEPPTGAVWTGTTQFALSDLAGALQRCLDEAIQVSNCNQTVMAGIATTPGAQTVPIPDNVLDVARAQFIDVSKNVSTLMRTDDTALNYYQPSYLQEDMGVPEQYNVASQPPLVMEVDVTPVSPGTYTILALESSATLTPPTASVLPIPNDNVWTVKWGALADLLSRESEATDLPRAAWCKQQYNMGLKLLSGTPWVIEASIQNVRADLVSVQEMDQYRPGWDTEGPDYATVVIAGTDTFAVYPDPNNPISVTLTVLGNTPVPSQNTDDVQVSRDVWDAVLDYAQFLACFKQGGAEFVQMQPLVQGFIETAKGINGRLEKLGLYMNLANAEGGREVRAQERFATQGA